MRAGLFGAAFVAVMGMVAVVSAEPVQQTLYINRCSGGCTVMGGGTDDATTHQTTIPCGGTVVVSQGGYDCTNNVAKTYMVSEYHNNSNQIGAAADAEWNQVMQCVREVYSPYNVIVTDQKPTGGVSYTEGILAGLPSEIGLGTSGFGGVGPSSSDCSPHSNVMSFSFANASFYMGPDRVYTLCYVVAQETAHAYGLDHEYSFTDGTSACRSPMTYRGDCGGERFFRDLPANCGENANRPCRCGGLQNSHRKLIAALGIGTPITRPPTVSILSPAMGSTIASATSIQAMAGAQRGIQHVDLWLNGHKWLSAKGAPWAAQGQPDPSNYQMTLPASVPDGVIDIALKAYDDLEIETVSTTVTVTKGAACTSAATCLSGQKCDAGKCYWDPPTGLLGDGCTYNEFCVSNLCQQSDVGQYCTQSCVLGSTDACPATFECAMVSDTTGVCLPQQPPGGGCCSVEREGDRAPWGALALSAIGCGCVLRRRRRH